MAQRQIRCEEVYLRATAAHTKKSPGTRRLSSASGLTRQRGVRPGPLALGLIELVAARSVAHRTLSLHDIHAVPLFFGQPGVFAVADWGHNGTSSTVTDHDAQTHPRRRFSAAERCRASGGGAA